LINDRQGTWAVPEFGGQTVKEEKYEQYLSDWGSIDGGSGGDGPRCIVDDGVAGNSQ
jgi:hypothetical protein